MKAIKNIDSLIERLSQSDIFWQKTIYEATGVILLESRDLVSKCGYISLDQDSEYSYSHGVDTTEYCEINTVNEVISYIKGMESYAEALMDISYGNFSKAELFWGIYNRILLQHDNLDNTGVQYWRLYNIGHSKEHLELHMALLPCDLTDICIDVSTETSLDEALNMLISELNVEVDNFDWLPMQKIFDVNYTVPNTYDELYKECMQGIFDWLNHEVL